MLGLGDFWAMRRNVTIGQLRREHPDWHWTVKRKFFGGCEYIGCNGKRVVELYFRGGCWHVYELGTTAVPYTEWQG